MMYVYLMKIKLLFMDNIINNVLSLLGKFAIRIQYKYAKNRFIFEELCR